MPLGAEGGSRVGGKKKGICGEEEIFFAHNFVDVADSLMEDFKGPAY